MGTLLVQIYNFMHSVIILLVFLNSSFGSNKKVENQQPSENAVPYFTTRMSGNTIYLLVTITNGTLQDSGKSYIDKVEHY